MKKNNVNEQRRDFLKKTSLGVAGSALSGGMVGVVSKSAVAKEAEMKTVVTAAHWGPIGVVVEDGKVVKSGPAIEPAVPNELQTVVADQLYSETRVKYPMVRKGFLANPGKSDTTMRGHDEWVRVSWDEALDLVHNQLKRVRDEHGPTGIFAGSYGLLFIDFNGTKYMRHDDLRGTRRVVPFVAHKTTGSVHVAL